MCRMILSKNLRSTELAGDWDQPLDLKFEELDVFKAFHDHFVEGTPWQETKFYARVVNTINDGHKRWNCSTEEQFLDRLCNDVNSLFDTIKSEGYKSQEELSTNKPHDEIRVAVDRGGNLLFVDGRHRLSIAKLLKQQKIPVKIVLRHSESQTFRS